MFPLLPFENMSERHRGLTSSIANALAEAARVCLDRHHGSPKSFFVKNNTVSNNALVKWSHTDVRTLLAWKNRTDTTEMGACAFALAAVELFEGFYAVSRAETHTGADYYIAPYGKTAADLEDVMRLEVSGVDNGNRTAVEYRLRQKIEQLKKGRSKLPGKAAVVGFSESLILMENMEDS
ncbi:hypothetical protein MBAV_000065 [Candidatus Magnetobacterium bavaricum]|uniref:Uncharacterized protein n=1 Tax=Candidatus Magnetobacterium bavaricum TaxID=29290 RepID=A0A0F3H0J1_9BACT|nr:hypothetical protein MBAV_000065 [Candidatus Magnetobacterium bavaricum]